MYISGELLQSYCKWNLDTRYEPRLWTNDTLMDGDRVFLKMSDIPFFLANPPCKRVRLVIHNSDETFEEYHFDMLESYTLSIQAVNCNSSRAGQLPLGFRDNQYTAHLILDEVKNEGHVEKDIFCLVNFLIETNPKERSNCFNYFTTQTFCSFEGDYFTYDKQKSLTHTDAETLQRRKDFYRLLKRSKFVICPQGTGVDTHRFYEALFFGAIPIVKTSFLDKLYVKYGNIVIVNEWSDVNYDFLKSKLPLEFYSQQGEDVLTYKRYINKVCDDGVFLEIGGYDGVTYSNTKFFEDVLNFKGILIEPVKSQFDKLVQNRKKNICLNCAIDTSEKEVEILGDDATAGIVNYMSESFNQKHHSSTRKTERAMAYPLSKILKDHKITYVDFFSLDVEGGEEFVLRSIDFDAIQFYVICIELDGHNPQKDQNCREILSKNGFKFDLRMCINEFWINENYGRRDKLYSSKSWFTPAFRFLEQHLIQEVTEKLFNSNITFITYGDTVFEKSRTRLVQEAQNTGIFKRCIGYTPENLDKDFKKTCEGLLTQKKGGGYWCWKPHIVLKTMQSIPENDWILYADAGCTLIQERKFQVFEQIEIMERSGKFILGYQMPHLIEKYWTKPELLEFMRVSENKDITETGQYVGGVFLIKNNKITREIMHTMESIMKNHPNLIDDSHTNTNDPSFQQHRHDQSLFSLVRKINFQYMYSIPKDETFHGNAFVQALRIK